jgi:hypothetical protein
VRKNLIKYNFVRSLNAFTTAVRSLSTRNLPRKVHVRSLSAARQQERETTSRGALFPLRRSLPRSGICWISQNRDNRAELARNVEAKRSGRATLIEARRQRCRQARYENLAVVELGRQGDTQLAIAEKFGIGAETVARWLRAPVFPERRSRSDRKRDRARFLHDQERVCMRPWLELISPPAGSPLSC